MKIKHNKIRNIGLIYEMLVRQITTDTLNNKDSEAVSILRKYFNNTEISKEYRIYSIVSSAKHLSESKANILLETALSAYKKINKVKTKKEKYDLISEIKKTYDIDEFFKPKLENYKILASLFMLLENESSKECEPESVAKYKFSILESISKPKEETEKDEILEQFNNMDKGARVLVYKLMVNNFNDKYSGLDTRQKSLLREYINNISTPDKFKSYINEEINAVKNTLKGYLKKVKDPVRKVKLEEIYNILSPIPESKKITENDVHNLLSHYELLKEIENVTNP